MLDPQWQRMLAAAPEGPDLPDLPPAAARAMYRQLIAAGDLPDSPPLAAVEAEDRLVPAGSAPAVPVRLYTPPGLAAHRSSSRNHNSSGLVLYLHGGGFVVGDLDGYDRLMRQLCLDSGCRLVAVDYRLAPEHPFPAAVDDARAALRWAFEQAGALGVDPTRIGVAGDSAGGNLAAGLALWARDEGLPLRYQALAYPVTGAPGRRPTVDSPVLTPRLMARFDRDCFGAGAAPDWRGAPLLAPSMQGVAPALVMVAGHDLLHDEGVAYAHRLCEAGVPASLVVYAGLAHGFLHMAGVLDAARLAVDQFGRALQRALQP